MKMLKFFSLTLMMAIYILSASTQKIADNNIGKITTAYLSMKNALVENDGTTAKVKANELYTLLASQPDKGLKLKQSKLLAIYLEPLLDNTRPICKTIDENEQRDYLSTLSKNMFELLKGLKLNTLT
jgi:hypothetical protein